MKMRSISKYLLVVAAGLLFVFSAQLNGQSVGAGRASNSSGGRYSITVKVYLPDGEPAVGVSVAVRSNEYSSALVTDQDGICVVGGVPAGNYTATASMDGLAPQTDTKTIYSDTPANQSVYMTIFLRGTKKADVYATSPLFKDVPKQALAKFQSAMEKLDKDDLKTALLLFDGAIAAYPNFAAAYYQKGSALLKASEYDAAIKAFVEAISIKSDYLEAKYGYGLAMLEKKNYEVAEAVFRDVIKQKADMTEARMNLGISLFYLKNADAAAVELKTVVAATGGERLALAHLYLGQIYIQKKQKAEAVAELQKYLEMVPKAPNADRIKAVIADLKK